MSSLKASYDLLLNLPFFIIKKEPKFKLKVWPIAMHLLNNFLTTIIPHICICLLFVVTTVGYEIRTSNEKQLKPKTCTV